MDIISSIFANDDIDNDNMYNWTFRPDKMQRQFTIMSNQHTDLWTLSFMDIKRMINEFLEIYQEMFMEN